MPVQLCTCPTKARNFGLEREGCLEEVEGHWLRSIGSISGLEQMYFDIMFSVIVVVVVQ